MPVIMASNLMETKEEYKKAFKLVRSVITEWDPYGLLSGGAPEDEFDAEVAKIVAHIPNIHSASDTARAVFDVFFEAFEHERFSATDCAHVGQKLYSRLVEAGLVPNEI